jgi:UDP-N-acetylglucosamine 2-epimerase (non-hydrolysing)
MPEDRKTIAVVIGTRPEAIKLAPVIRELKRDTARYDVKVVATAQHRELLDRVLALFEIETDVDLDIMRADQDLFGVTQKALGGLGKAFAELGPDLVLVQGDTTSVFAGALAAFYHQIPVAHVEAGLRTEQRYSPFPEEINRHLTGVLTDLHFAPTSKAAWNLRHEGYDESQITITGNTVIDALLDVADREEAPLPEGVDPDKPLILVTAHRRESFGAPLERAFGALAELAKMHPEAQIVYPVHPNPKVQKAAKDNLSASTNIILLEPMDYAPFVSLMKRATLVLTDSGGIQEEAPSLGVPVLVLRPVTERPEAVGAGTVKLVGTDPAKIIGEAHRLLTDADYHASMAAAVNPYGDGKASERIAAVISHFFFKTDRPADFTVEDDA